MLNRRKLIQLSLSEIPSETEYLDYKQSIDLSSESGRGKLIRLICAMSNSNPFGRSFIFVGINDSKKLVGAPFIDDAVFQNAIKGFINNCPKITYENVVMTSLASEKFIGIISIYPNSDISEVCKSIWKLKVGDSFFRKGSTTERGKVKDFSVYHTNKLESVELVDRASVTLESTLNSTLEFYKTSLKSYNPRHYVFNDQYVVAISSWENDDNSFSEVTIHLLNENISFFWSALERVTLEKTEQSIIIEELATLFWSGERNLIPKKRIEINFSASSAYEINSCKLSKVPKLEPSDINEFLTNYKNRLSMEFSFIEILPYELLFGALNGSSDCLDLLLDKNGGKIDGSVAESYHDAIQTLNELLPE